MTDSTVAIDEGTDIDGDGDGTVDGRTFLAAVKDGLYVLFAIFFGVILWGYNSVYPRSGGAVLSGGGTIDVVLNEFAIEGNLVAGAGEVTFNVVNEGTVIHNVVVRETGVKSLDLGVGGTNVVELGEMAPGSYELFCSITGHEESGMVATLTVVEPEPEAEAEPAAGAEPDSGS